jgi:hypothetical protein
MSPHDAYTGTDKKQKYSSNRYTTRHYNKMGGQHHAPVSLTTGKAWCSLYKWLGGYQGRSRRQKK